MHLRQNLTESIEASDRLAEEARAVGNIAYARANERFAMRCRDLLAEIDAP
jgi:hypothetical protein